MCFCSNFRILLRCRRQRILAAVFALLCFVFVILMVFQPIRLVMVNGRSMEPTLYHGQLVFMKQPGNFIPRGSVVLACVQGKYLIKRVSYLSGETVTLVRNGEDIVLSEERFRKNWEDSWGWHLYTEVVPHDNFFLMGDNPLVSEDSRYFGSVNRSQIVGVSLHPL